MRRVSIALFVGALTIMSIFLGAGTYAYTTGESFIIDFSSPNIIKPVISGLSPGETVYIVIKIPNSYGRAVTAWISLKNVVCSENGVVEPEQEWYNLYGVRNDIDKAITFGLWIDRDGDTSTCSERDILVIDEDRHISDIKGEAIPLGKIPARSSITVVTSYHMDEETENWAQSDTMTFDIERTLEVPSGKRSTPPSLEIIPTPPPPTPNPAEFILSNLSIKPAEVEPGEEVTISLKVTNIGNLEGSTTIELYINDVKEQSKPITLAGGDSTTVSFSVTKTTELVYTVKIGTLTGSFEVKAPPSPPLRPAEFLVLGLSITPAEVEPGEPVTISVLVINIGEEKGTCTLNLNVEDEQTTMEVTLMGGESKELEFNVTRETKGTYKVEVNGLTGTFEVLPKPGIVWLSPGYISGILILIIATCTTLYMLYRRGHLQFFIVYPRRHLDQRTREAD